MNVLCYLVVFLFVGTSKVTLAKTRSEMGHTSKTDSLDLQTPEILLPALTVTNCPTLLYSALSGKRFYELFALKKEATQACAFPPPTAQEDINFQKENWNSSPLPSDYKQLTKLFENTKSLDFKFSNTGVGQAWCRQSNECTDPEGVSRKPIVDQLLADFPKYRQFDKAYTEKITQCMELNKWGAATGDNVLSICHHQANEEFQKTVEKSSLFESSPLLRDEDFASKLNDLVRANDFNSVSIDRLTVQYLEKQRSAMVGIERSNVDDPS